MTISRHLYLCFKRINFLHPFLQFRVQFSPPRFLMCIPRFVPTRESLYDFLVECVFVCLTQHRSYAAPCRFLFTLQGRTARFVGVVGLPILFRECFHTFLLRHRISSAVIAQSTCSTYPAGRLFSCQGTRKFCLPYIPRHKK